MFRTGIIVALVTVRADPDVAATVKVYAVGWMAVPTGTNISAIRLYFEEIKLLHYTPKINSQQTQY